MRLLALIAVALTIAAAQTPPLEPGPAKSRGSGGTPVRATNRGAPVMANGAPVEVPLNGFKHLDVDEGEAVQSAAAGNAIDARMTIDVSMLVVELLVLILIFAEFVWKISERRAEKGAKKLQHRPGMQWHPSGTPLELLAPTARSASCTIRRYRRPSQGVGEAAWCITRKTGPRNVIHLSSPSMTRTPLSSNHWTTKRTVHTA